MIFMPMSGNNTNIGEPNDSCLDAIALTKNHQHRFFADNKDDWYLFDLASSASVVVTLSDFQVNGQIVIFKGPTCDSIIFIDNNGNNQSTKIVNLGTRGQGRYYIWIINDDAPSYIPYHLEVDTN
jgi:hypothetical protein